MHRSKSEDVRRDEVKGNIVIKDLQYFYSSRPDKMILNNINLHISAGSTVALVGASGGGKSTLVHMLMRFYDPISGSILLDGVDLKEINVRNSI